MQAYHERSIIRNDFRGPPSSYFATLFCPFSRSFSPLDRRSVRNQERYRGLRIVSRCIWVSLAQGARALWVHAIVQRRSRCAGRATLVGEVGSQSLQVNRGVNFISWAKLGQLRRTAVPIVLCSHISQHPICFFLSRSGHTIFLSFAFDFFFSVSR